MNELTVLMSTMVARDASDMYLNVGAPPTLKIQGELHGLKSPDLDANKIYQFIDDTLTREQRGQFDALLELDLSLEFERIGRFRLNVYKQKNYPALVVRFIKDDIPSIKTLGLPDIYHDLIMEQRGLILVVGSTGSGKSTTVAAMLDYRNENQGGHILTVEDPIEYTHRHKKSLISQREVGIDTHSYEEGLKYALREAPDVIMIGEIRDSSTAKQALRYAETGHLCISTMHASNTTQAIDRFLSFFNGDDRQYIRKELSDYLVAILSQRLVRSKQNTRAVAAEVLLNTSQIAKLICESKNEEIRDALSSDMSPDCQTFDDALYLLLKQEKISELSALQMADSRVDFTLRLQYDRTIESTVEQTQQIYWCSEEVDFNRYKNAMVSAISLSVKQRPELKDQFNQAIGKALQERSYRLVEEKPDILFRYSYGLRYDQDIGLKEVDEQAESLPEIGVAIKALDGRNGKVLWYMLAARPMVNEQQQELNVEMANLFAALPFARHGEK